MAENNFELPPTPPTTESGPVIDPSSTAVPAAPRPTAPAPPSTTSSPWHPDFELPPAAPAGPAVRTAPARARRAAANSRTRAIVGGARGWTSSTAVPGPSAGAQPARPSTTDRSPGPTPRLAASAEARSCSRTCQLLAGYSPASASAVGDGSEEPGKQLGLSVRCFADPSAPVATPVRERTLPGTATGRAGPASTAMDTGGTATGRATRCTTSGRGRRAANAASGGLVSGRVPVDLGDRAEDAAPAGAEAPAGAVAAIRPGCAVGAAGAPGPVVADRPGLARG